MTISAHPAPRHASFTAALFLAFGAAGSSPLAAQTTLRILPGEATVVAVGQRFDIRVEATGSDPAGAPPRGLRVEIDGRDVTSLNILDPGVGGEAGAGGTGSSRPEVPERHRASAAPSHTTNFLVRERSFDVPGPHTITARTADGAEATATVMVEAWQESQTPGGATPPNGARLPRVRNVILLLGDGMGIAARTAARVVSRGLTDGKANGLLSMDRMEATGLVMTSSLNSVITDSAPGMSALSTGSKGNNNQVGVYPDNTIEDAFDNPRIEYIGEFLRRMRGDGFNVGLVTTADVADATPAGNAVHSANRSALPQIARQYLAERETNGVSVLLGGGSRHFTRAAPEGSPHATLLESFVAAGYEHLTTASDVAALMSSGTAPPARLLGLFHPTHMNVAFDKLGQGRYSDELADSANADRRDQPMLDDLARLALASLSAHSPDGFYLMIEGASIDKQAHAADADRAIWDTIEFDRAVGVALEFAERTNTDDDPDNETLVIVASDHETGGLSLVAVGNERYDPAVVGTASRDYAAVYRFDAAQTLNFFTNYPVDDEGFPRPVAQTSGRLGGGSRPLRELDLESYGHAPGGLCRHRRPSDRRRQSAPRRAGGECRQPHRRGGGNSRISRAGRDREWSTRVSRFRRMPRRHGRHAAGAERAHRERRADLGQRSGGDSVHRHLRQHRGLHQDAARRGRQLEHHPEAPSLTERRGTGALEGC